MVVSCSTPTTISASRSTRCLVGSTVYYIRGKSGKCPGWMNRLTQIMNLLLLAPDIQDEILRLGTAADQKLVPERHVRPVVKFVLWERQRRAWRTT